MRRRTPQPRSRTLVTRRPPREPVGPAVGEAEALPGAALASLHGSGGGGRGSHGAGGGGGARRRRRRGGVRGGAGGSRGGGGAAAGAAAAASAYVLASHIGTVDRAAPRARRPSAFGVAAESRSERGQPATEGTVRPYTQRTGPLKTTLDRESGNKSALRPAIRLWLYRTLNSEHKTTHESFRASHPRQPAPLPPRPAWPPLLHTLGKLYTPAIKHPKQVHHHQSRCTAIEWMGDLTPLSRSRSRPLKAATSPRHR